MQTQEMNGIVLCAGLGTRLRPLTSAIPKPAVPVGPVPAALRNAEQLLSAGIAVVHCNTHYLAPELEGELKAACLSRGIPQSRLRFWNEPEILETGGGIARIAQTLASESGHSRVQDSLVVSGDIVADFPIAEMIKIWSKRRAVESTLMVSLPLDRPRKDVTWVDEANHRVRGFGTDFDPETATSLKLTGRVFSNHQIISGAVLERARLEKRSSIDLFYRAALQRGEEILHIPFQQSAHWFDIGTPESYFRCLSVLKQDPPKHLSKEKLSKLNLCLPSVDQQRVDSHSSSEKSRHAHQRSALTAFAQDCLGKTEQKTEWLWAGTLHSLPGSLELGLSELLRANSAWPSKNSHFSEDGITLKFVSQDGSFLNLRRDSTFGHLTESLTHSEGFIDACVPPALSSHPLLQAPLLVPLDLLLGAGSNLSQMLNQPRSPFWVLFTQRKL